MSSDGIDLVVTDLDGTLWNERMEIPGSTFDALAELERADIPVLVATGRRRRSAELGQRHNGLHFPSVLLNGSLGIDLRTDEQFHVQAFSETTARSVLEIYDAHEVGPCAYTAGRNPDVLVGERVSTHPAHAETLAPTWHQTDLGEALTNHEILGFSTLGHRTREELDPLVRELTASTDATLVVAFDPGFDGWSLMAQPPAVSKWNGIEAFCRRIGVDSARVLAIGDAENDIEMLTNAAVGVAMGNAPATVQAAADHTTAALDAGGWAAAVLEAIA